MKAVFTWKEDGKLVVGICPVTFSEIGSARGLAGAKIGNGRIIDAVEIISDEDEEQVKARDGSNDEIFPVEHFDQLQKRFGTIHTPSH